ncbi:nitroreductase family protein [Lentzea albida]|uniref:Nitroreductase n=1 Tax=Lentzea albida TaxID=65499 RepID=A0A1H9MPI7_9PSEU|nr:nitroreductase family protein [Lentzea albida]SER25053.1 Nitroreductase [Lentzea albida]
MLLDSAEKKNAATDVPVHPLLSARWSSRAFDPAHELGDDQLTALLEAARWAPSASNTQPWRFAVARRGTAEHGAVLGTLAGGNQVWARDASALVVVAARTTGTDGAAQPWAVYDAGQAVAHLSVQAQAEGLAVHQMGGFDRDGLTSVLPGDVTPLVVVAVGLRDEPTRLAESLAERETAARVRLPLDALLLTVQA